MFTLPYPKNSAEVYLAIAAGMTGLAYPYLPGDRVPTTEIFLAHLAGDFSHQLPSPKNRVEVLLAHAVGDTSIPIIPGSLTGRVLIGVQMVDIRYLAYLAGIVGVVLPEQPENRTEEYFAAIANGIPAGAVLKTARGINIALKDVLGGIKSLDYIYGDTFQQTYSGKNLVGFIDKAQTTENGLTYSIENGIFTVNGTATATTYLETSELFNLGNSTSNFTISIKPISGVFTSGIVGVSFKNSSSGQVIWHQLNSSLAPQTKEYTSANIETISYIQPYINKDSVFDNYKFYLQIEKGSAATAYEPYVGGYASPSPMYPQEVQTVTGRQVVEVSGKNLFDKDNANTLNGYFTPSTTVITQNQGPAIETIIYIPCKPQATYTIQKYAGTVFSIGTTNIQPAIGVQVYNIKSGNTSENLTLTTDNGSKYIVARVWRGSSDTVTLQEMLNSIQIELGSTATDFEPYVAPASYNVDLTSKNLFNVHSQYRSLGAGITIAEDGWVTFTGDNTSGSSAQYFNLWTIPSADLEISTNYKIALEIKEVSGNGAFYVLDANTNNSGQFNTNASIQFSAVNPGDVIWKSGTTRDSFDGCITMLRSYFRLGVGDAGSITCRISVLPDDTPTGSFAYLPYHKYELCKIGNKQDYIYKDGTDWYLHREVRHLSLLIANMDNERLYPGWRQQTTVLADVGAGRNSALGYITQFCTNTASSAQQYGTYCVSVNTSTAANGVVFFPRTYYNNIYGGDWTQDYWKTTFPDLVFELYYAIINIPEDEKITNAALVSQLNTLSRAVLPKPGATIAVSGNLAGEIEISYWGEE